jgi:hypothetical protein
MRALWKASPQILSALALLGTSGCMTHALWSGEAAESFHEPSSPNRMALYEAPNRREVLVRYDELSPWSDSPRPRAYLLRENSARIQSQRKPRFVALSATNGFSPIPLLYENRVTSIVGNAFGSYATTSTNGNQFTIVRINGQAQSCYELPTYRGATGNLKLVLLTPVTLVVDAGIVGGVAGYIFLAAVAHSGSGIIYEGRL